MKRILAVSRGEREREKETETETETERERGEEIKLLVTLCVRASCSEGRRHAPFPLLTDKKAQFLIQS